MAPVYSIDKEMPRLLGAGRTMLATSASSDRTLHRRMSSASFAGLDLRQVEDVVDQGEQMLPVPADHRRVVVPAARIDRRIHQQVGIAEDRRSWGCGFRGSCWPGSRLLAWFASTACFFVS